MNITLTKDKIKSSNLTLEEAFKIFLDNRRNYLKPKTILKYEANIKHLINFFGDDDILNINTKKIQNFIDFKSKQNYSNSFIKGCISTLKSSICEIDENKHFNALFYPHTKETAKQVKCYSDEEINKILGYLLKITQEGFINQNNFTIGIIIAIYTGLRISEIVSLKWQDINFEENYIDVNKQAIQLKNIKATTTPKSLSSIRIIPLHPVLKKVLKEHKNKYKNQDYVLNKEGEQISIRSLQFTNEKVCKIAGVQYKGFHAYRHYFATSLLKKSNNIKAVSEMLGHSNTNITLNIYNNPSLEDKRKILNLIEKR